MKVTTVRADIAKRVFQVHGVNEQGAVVLRRRLQRDEVAPFFTNLPACRVGPEASGGAQHWARRLSRFGHTIRLIARRQSYHSAL
jgi:transposase